MIERVITQVITQAIAEPGLIALAALCAVLAVLIGTGADWDE